LHLVRFEIGKSMWTRFSPFLAVVVASLAWGMFSETHFIGKVGEGWSKRVSVELVNQGLPAALLLAMLWLLKRTALWKRRLSASTQRMFTIRTAIVGCDRIVVSKASLERA